MDIQKLITDVVAKLKADPDLLKNFATNPADTVKKLLNISLDTDQLNQIIEGVKGKVDLSSIDVSQASGIIGKIKGLFGK